MKCRWSSADVLIALLICSGHISWVLSASTPLEETVNFETLQFVQVIFRHGDRNPNKSFPTDPYKNVSVYWPEGLGQLTDVGKMRLYDLGRYLRQRYNTFISPTYVEAEIEVLSSDLDRTIMSAEANLAGFYQPINSTLNWNPNISWPPVLIQTIPKYEDKFLQQTKPCKRYDQLLSDFMNTSEVFQQFLKDIQDFLDTLRVESGLGSNATFIETLEVIDVLQLQEKHNLTLPDWVVGEIYSQIHSVGGQYIKFETYTPELSRLRIGALLKLLIENVDKVAGTRKSSNGDKVTKLVMFSGHDKIMAGILNSLGVFNMIVPDFGTAIMLELHKEPNIKIPMSM